MLTFENMEFEKSESHNFYSKITIRIYDRIYDQSWPEPFLALTCMGQIANWLRFLNYTCKSDLKSCAACPKKKNLWFWWPFVTYRDLSWPDRDPDAYLVWHLCSQNIITSPFRLPWLSFEQKLSILPALGFIIQKWQSSTYDLTLTRELSSLLKF